MKKLMHCMFWTVFLLLFVCHISETRNNTFPEIIVTDDDFDLENVDIESNYSLKANCICQNGDCVEGKGCVCWPEYGKVSDTKCHACNCGEGNNCTITIGSQFSSGTTCICKEKTINGPCKKCNCGKNFQCTVEKGSFFTSDTVKCICKEGYVKKGDRCVVNCNDTNLCKNGGNCKKEGHYSFCECIAGTTGPTCNDVSDCINDILRCEVESGAVCGFNVKDNRAECFCQSGLKYETASKTCRVNCNDTNLCKNGGNCKEEGHYSFCECIAGTTGPTCNVVSDCSNEIVKCEVESGAVCGFNVKDYRAECLCQSGLKYDTGSKTCRVNCNYTNLCQNGGNCKKEGHYSFCECIPGTTGPTCNDVSDCINEIVKCEVESGAECGFNAKDYRGVCLCQSGLKYDTTSKTCREILGCETKGGKAECLAKKRTCENKIDNKSEYDCGKCIDGYEEDTQSKICREILGCETKGGEAECLVKKRTCTNNPYKKSVYDCGKCIDGYEEDTQSKICNEILACESEGGEAECLLKRRTCINKSNRKWQYDCGACIDGYKEDVETEQCIENLGCEDFGGETECRRLNKLCINDYTSDEKYKCRGCLPGYRQKLGKCLEILGCEDLGGETKCQFLNKLCINDKTLDKMYKCDACLPGYREEDEKCLSENHCDKNPGVCDVVSTECVAIDFENYFCRCKAGYKLEDGLEEENKKPCIEKLGCEDLGGQAECQELNKICVNEETFDKKFKCGRCLPQYREEDGNCQEKLGCEHLGGFPECQEFKRVCINDRTSDKKFKCGGCLPNYIEEDGECLECFCGEQSYSCALQRNGQKSCKCHSRYVQRNGTCVDCDCGKQSYSCRIQENGQKYCSCYEGYAQRNGTCTECFCGNGSKSCIFQDNREKFCVCNEGHAPNNGTCRATCNPGECFNNGICRSFPWARDKFCYCDDDFKGDKCEINEACMSIENICNAMKAVCKYVPSLKKAFCECPPSTQYDWNLNYCVEKPSSLLFITMCIASGFLLVSTLTLIIVFRKFKSKISKK